MHASNATEARPCVLGFDTATERLAVGVDAGGRRFVVDAEGGAAASAALLPQVHALLARAGVSLQALDFIAFGRGPGAFTGLRTACAVAQGLGLGLSRPLLPIDSLLIVAEDARAQLQAPGDTAPFAVDVRMDARMNEVYAADYLWQDGRWCVLRAPALVPLPALSRHDPASGVRAEPRHAVAGSALAAFGAALPVVAGAERVVREADRAGALLRLALQAAADGACVDPADALPLYLRDKVALTTAEREAVRALAATP